MKDFVLLLTLTIFYHLVFSNAFPVKLTENSNTPIGASALLPFLKRFGYLEGGNNSTSIESDTLFTEESVEDAIKDMQKFGGVEQTGKLNKETLALLSKPRCGLPDIIRNRDKRVKRYVIGADGWNKRRITYRIDNWAPQLSEGTVDAEVRKAFDVWADYARLRFIGRPRGNSDDVDISISFGRGYHGDRYQFDGSGGVLAHAFFPYGHGSLGGDIHFDLDENWASDSQTTNNYNGAYPVSFLSVAVHEIGHSLGLSHSPSQDSVMFPYYQYPELGDSQFSDVRLGYDDIMAMYKLYIQRNIEDFPDADYDDTTSTSTTMASTTDHFPTTTTGDFTTIKPGESTSTLGPVIDGKIPDICKNDFLLDSISFIRNELFVFKDKYMWRFRELGIIDATYPVQTSRLFPMLADVPKIDAAFESENGNIFFFSGNKYWTYEEKTDFKPHPISEFGLPEYLSKIDAAFIWGKNKKLYIFSGNLFWKYNMTSKRMDEGYPKGLERWRGLPENGIDSVLKYADGRTYFFKDDKFWRFDDDSVHTDEGFPLKAAPFWFGC